MNINSIASIRIESVMSFPMKIYSQQTNKKNDNSNNYFTSISSGDRRRGKLRSKRSKFQTVIVFHAKLFLSDKYVNCIDKSR